MCVSGIAQKNRPIWLSLELQPFHYLVSSPKQSSVALCRIYLQHFLLVVPVWIFIYSRNLPHAPWHCGILNPRSRMQPPSKAAAKDCETKSLVLGVAKHIWSWPSHCPLFLKDSPSIWNIQMQLRKFFSRSITQVFNNPKVYLNIKCLMQPQPLTRLNYFFGAPHWLGGNSWSFQG